MSEEFIVIRRDELSKEAVGRVLRMRLAGINIAKFIEKALMDFDIDGYENAQCTHTFAGKLQEGKQLSVFHQVERTTQVGRVMWHLQEYGFITNKQCHELYGIRHCPSVIRDIREKLAKEGRYEIVNREKKGCNRYGEPTTWDEYVLKEKEQKRV